MTSTFCCARIFNHRLHKRLPMSICVATSHSNNFSHKIIIKIIQPNMGERNCKILRTNQHILLHRINGYPFQLIEPLSPAGTSEKVASAPKTGMHSTRLRAKKSESDFFIGIHLSLFSIGQLYHGLPVNTRRAQEEKISLKTPCHFPGNRLQYSYKDDKTVKNDWGTA